MNDADFELLGRRWANEHTIKPVRLTGYPSGPEWRWDLAEFPTEFHAGLRDTARNERDAYRLLGTQISAHAGSITRSTAEFS